MITCNSESESDDHSLTALMWVQVSKVFFRLIQTGNSAFIVTVHIYNLFIYFLQNQTAGHVVCFH